MAVVPRNVLKSFFQTGDKPTSAQFSTMLDSILVYSDDRDLVGLKEYDPTLVYVLGDSVIYNKVIYQAKTTTTPGSFNISQWDKIAGSTPGSVNFKGTWDADANDPDLSSLTPDIGDYYVVSVAGDTPLNSPPYTIDEWGVGDWAIYNGTRWEKVDNTDSVSGADNVGSGAGIFKGKNVTTLEFRSLTDSSGSLNAVEMTDTIDVSINFDDVGTSANRAMSAFAVKTSLNSKENLSNKVISVNGSSTDTEYASAKCLYDGLQTKEPVITGTGSTADFWSGAKTFRNLAGDVRASVLTGLSLATNQVISATDTILQAFGYLQKQITDNLSALTTHIGNVSNPHAVTKAQVGLANVQDIKVNNTAVADPGASDDNSQGYSGGSTWINSVTGRQFVCTSAATGAAVWKELTNIFGNNYQLKVYSTPSSTSSNSFQPNVGNPPAAQQVLTTGALTGTYRIQWSCVIGNNKKQGEFRFVDYSTPASPVQIGPSVFYEGVTATDQITIGNTINVVLSGTSKDYIIQFRAVGSSSTETIYESKIEIFRVI